MPHGERLRLSLEGTIAPLLVVIYIYIHMFVCVCVCVSMMTGGDGQRLSRTCYYREYVCPIMKCEGTDTERPVLPIAGCHIYIYTCVCLCVCVCVSMCVFVCEITKPRHY